MKKRVNKRAKDRAYYQREKSEKEDINIAEMKYRKRRETRERFGKTTVRTYRDKKALVNIRNNNKPGHLFS